MYPADKDLDVLVIGSCMTDLTAYTSRIPKIGETIHGRSFSIGFGGKGGNQCVAAAKLGARAAMIAKLGTDTFGENYFKNLEDHGINISHVDLVDQPSGVAQICVDDDGNNNIVIIAGANNELHCSDVENAENLIRNSKVVMFQLETPLESTIRALEICEKHSCTVIFNAAPGIPNLDEKIFRLSDIFCVNETEAEIVTGERIDSITNAKSAAKKLLSMGCRLPIITLGGNGVVFATNEHCEAVHVAVDAMKPLDTTGAGDVFLGAMGFYVSTFKTLSMEETIKRCCKVAGYSVQKLGAQISYPRQVDLPSHLFAQ